MNELKPSEQAWVTERLNSQLNITRLAGDASTRSFFRVCSGDKSYVLMSWPQWDLGDAYLRISNWLKQSDLHVPDVLAFDKEQGLILQSDLGKEHYLDALNIKTADTLYGSALNAIKMIQLAGQSNPPEYLPTFTKEYLHKQINVFGEWFVPKYHPASNIENTINQVIEEIDSIPKTVIHFDFHSRNLMVTDDNAPGILDFQDAMWGPHTYDLVGLLNDCYIDWPREKVEQWLQLYYQWAFDHAITHLPFEAWLKQFDYTALQRHLKNLGVFMRLAFKFNKTFYLKHIPRVLNYIKAITKRYEPLEPLAHYFKEDISL